jgi:hypothetical protein
VATDLRKIGIGRVAAVARTMIDRRLAWLAFYFSDFVRTDPTSARQLYQIVITRVALNRHQYDPPPHRPEGGDIDIKFGSKHKIQISATQQVRFHRSDDFKRGQTRWASEPVHALSGSLIRPSVSTSVTGPFNQVCSGGKGRTKNTSRMPPLPRLNQFTNASRRPITRTNALLG